MIKENMWQRVLLLFFILMLSGCAAHKFQPTHPQDPYEYYNRKVFAFNMAVDRAVYRPIAKVYDAILPWVVKKGIRNFFSNLGEVTSIANEILQLHFKQVIADIARFAINTTAGVGGIFDVATELGLEKDKEDFGLTLASWGSKNTPYLVVPFMGCYTLRDLIGVPVDTLFLSVWPYIKDDTLRLSLQATKLIQHRASLLPGDELIDEAFDPYIFMRNAYLQRREYMIKEARAEHMGTYVDEKGIVHRRHRSIPVDSVVDK